MKCAEDITLFNSFIQKQRLYQFLYGINESLNKEKRDLLYLEPLPTLDQAYSAIQCEISRRHNMGGVLSSGRCISEVGSGLAINHRSKNPSSRRDDRSNLTCTHFGGSRHTREGCFKLIEYPEWWDEHKQRKTATKATISWTANKVNVVTALPDDRKPPQEPSKDTPELLIGNNSVNNGERRPTVIEEGKRICEVRERAHYKSEKGMGGSLSKNNPFYNVKQDTTLTQIPITHTP